MKDHEPIPIDRRMSENQLKRLSVEADHQQDEKVRRWLKLADEFFSHDDPSSSAA